jgi:transposase
MRKPLEIPELTAPEAEALDTLYRTTRVVRPRTRAHIVLLAGEQRLTAPAIARIVREDEQTARRWLKRWLAEGIAGPQDRPMPGGPAKITGEYRWRLLSASAAGRAAWASPTPCGRCSAWQLLGRVDRAAPVVRDRARGPQGGRHRPESSAAHRDEPRPLVPGKKSNYPLEGSIGPGGM